MNASFTPPSDSPASLLGWACTVILAGLLIIWKLRESERTKTITALETRLKDKEDVIVRLGEKIDAINEARIEDAKKTVLAIARRSTAQQISHGVEQWEEAPSIVKDMMKMMSEMVDAAQKPVKDPFPELEEWTPSRSDNPPKRTKK